MNAKRKETTFVHHCRFERCTVIADYISVWHLCLQDYLAGRAPFVSTAMDNRAGIAYGSAICIPELNRKYGRVILFKVRAGFTASCWGRIC